MALVSAVQGTVLVLSEISGPSKQNTLLYEGKKYFYTNAKIGQKISSGNVLMTGIDGKTKIIFQHGDVMVLGSSSSIIIPNLDDHQANEIKMELLYGRVRSIIDKDGPLSGLKINTPSAVAGVRGTDLLVSYNSAEQTTKVEVVRGEVEVTVPTVQKPISVSSGESAKISPVEIQQVTPAAPEKYVAEVKRATPAELNQIETHTTLTREAEQIAALPEATKHEVSVAEGRAVANTLKDIRRYDKEQVQSLAQQGVKTSDELNTFSVEQLKAKPAERPPTEEERRRRAWSVAGGIMATTLTYSTYACVGGINCQANVTPGLEAGALRRFILSSSFGLKLGALLSYRTETASIAAANFTFTQIGIDLPILLSFNFNEHYFMHIGNNFVVGISQTSSCSIYNCSSNGGGLNAIPELAFGRSFAERWSAEVILQPASGSNIGFASNNYVNTSTTGNPSYNWSSPYMNNLTPESVVLRFERLFF